jgi:hydroxymethylbilane synthase
MRLVIASRRSDLARVQAYAVGDALQKKIKSLEVVYDFRESLGDKNLTDPLWKMPEKGVFTEDFYQGLVTGQYDMVVHSWKDLPVELRPDTRIAGTLPRADVRDVLLLKKSALKQKNKRTVIHTSSPRRIYNLGSCLSYLLPYPTEVQFESIRGNIQTRIRKLLEGEADGLVLAKAGLDRVLQADRAEFQETQTFLRQALEQLQWMILPISLNPTAAAQGALAIEVKNGRQDVLDAVAQIHCESTFEAVVKEREMLSGWGGGCHQKIGVNCLVRDYGVVVSAKGVRDTGDIIDRLEIEESALVEGPFQERPQAATWFEREDVLLEDSYKKHNAHWIARALALPASVNIDPSQVVWVSGVQTWKTLARRGIWVHGSSESMGEQEDPCISTLDGKERSWCKWTHSDGEPFEKGPLIATYKLVAKKEAPEYNSAKDNFFWMSGSSFKKAIETYPWLLDKTHWSGPGNTNKRIQTFLTQHKASGTARIALSLEEWQKLDRTKK